MAHRQRNIATLLALLSGSLALAAKPQEHTPETPTHNPAAQHATSEHAYHREPPTAPLPPTLNPAQFADNPAALVVYSVASKIREFLYQEPCYCYCDKHEGHTSLLDCYTSRHGVNCHICQREVIYTYEQSKLGKTAAQIREAMEKGAHGKFDRQKYVDEHYDEYRQHTP